MHVKYNFYLADNSSERLSFHNHNLYLILYVGMRPHSHHEHVRNPDTVLIHHHRGMEALSLRTGQPLTTVPLSGESHTYVDLLQTGHVSTIRMDKEACTIEVYLCNGPGTLAIYSTIAIA